MILVGLGNPGKEYSLTRHNVGFMVVDRLVNQLSGPPWKKERGVLWSKVGAHWIIKPQEFMNLSGPALQSFLAGKQLQPDDSTSLVVIHDDLDFPLGEIHEQRDRSAGGHNGVQSIIEALGAQSFSRVRIGIGNNRDQNIPAENYVLQPFSADEQKIIDEAINRVVDMLADKLQK